MGPVPIWREGKKLKNYLNKKGKLLNWTKIYTPPQGLEDQTPYFVGIVEFEDKKRLPLQIVEVEEKDLKTNLKIITIVRRGAKVDAADIIPYIIKAKPL